MRKSQNIKKHHKTRTENCKGNMSDPKDDYGKWAYWCPSKSSWLAKPCVCSWNVRSKI